MSLGVIDAEEMWAMVAALLTTDAKAHAALYAKTDPAIGRYLALHDPGDREDFRTALRDFTRTYAFLGQVVPFRSTELEELFYHGKVLLDPPTQDRRRGRWSRRRCAHSHPHPDHRRARSVAPRR